MAKVSTVKVSTLLNWQDNPRSIKKNRFEELKVRIKKHGFNDVLKVAADGVTVIGGNMRLRALKELGVSEVQVLNTGAKSDKEKFEIALDDNEEFGQYEREELIELAYKLSIPTLELNNYLVNLSEPVKLGDLVLEETTDTTEDEVPEVSSEPPVSQSGSIYQLGRHRVMCGDSTDFGQVSDLMDGTTADMVLTDPPYGKLKVFTDKSKDKVGIDGRNSKGRQVKARNYVGNYQNEGNFELEPIIKILDDLGIKKRVIWGGNFFSCLPIVNSWICWDKTGGDRNINTIFSDFELAWTNLGIPMRIFHFLWKGMMREGQRIERQHPTEKPIPLSAAILSKYQPKAKNILDLFGGSGSTLIACEQLDRTCYMMELDPKYCDVIRKRYAKLKDPEGWEEKWQQMTPKVQ